MTVEKVSIMTVGEAKGHDFFIDSQTLEGVRKLIEDDGGRVLVRAKHVTGDDGTALLLGEIANPVIEGQRLRGDLSIWEEAGETGRLYYRIARDFPHKLGLSVVMDWQPEFIDGQRFARPTALDTIDFTEKPAANYNGLLSEKPTTKEDKTMTEEEVTKLMEDKMASYEEKLSKLDEHIAKLESIEGKLSEYDEKLSKLESTKEEELAEEEKEAKLSEGAFKKLKSELKSDLETVFKSCLSAAGISTTAAATGGSPAGNPGNETEQLKSFLSTKMAEGQTKAAALTAARKEITDVFTKADLSKI